MAPISHVARRTLPTKPSFKTHRSRLSKRLILIILSLALLGLSFNDLSNSLAQSPGASNSPPATIARATKPKSKKRSSESTVGLGLNFVTPDHKGGVWLSGDAFQLRGLLLNDGRDGNLHIVTVQGVSTVSEPQFVGRDIGWMTDYWSLYQTVDGGTSWSRIDSLNISTITTLHFEDAQNGWVGGGNGEIYRTSDGGRAWKRQHIGFDYRIKEIFFVDLLHGWANAFSYPASGNGKMKALLRTIDGGETWETLSHVDGDSPKAIHKMFFVNTNEGWGIDSWQYNVVHTVDAGKTWKIQQRREALGWNSLTFIDNKKGWASGQGGLIHTADGGESWEYQIEPESSLAGSLLGGITFIDAKNGWAVCRDGGVRTTDGGNTWKPISDDWKEMAPSYDTVLQDPLRPAAAAFAHLKNQSEFAQTPSAVKTSTAAHPSGAETAAMGFTKQNQSATLTTSSGPVNLLGLPGPFRFESYCETNDGQRWTVGGLGEVLFLGVGPTRRYRLTTRLPFNGGLYGVYFNDQGLGWVVGDRGVIFHTPDNGNTWVEQSVGGEESLYAVTCANKEMCWAVGNNGLILRTMDAGKVWMKIETKNDEPLNAIEFIDTKTGWIATNSNGVVLHTTDGGLTWERQRVPVVCRHPCDRWGEAIHAIRFVNERVGWAASVDQIARTEDGGRTWKVTFADDSLTRIVGLVAHDEKKVWAIDEHGRNLFSDDGGRKWSPSSLEQPTASSLNQKDLGEVLTFSTIDGMGDKCVMVYGGPSLGSKGYLIQDCGDAQWKRKWSYDNGYIRSMSFLDDAKGWLVIGHALVKVERVKDKLDATIVRNDPNDGIESVFFINDLYGWTCGDKGSIHRTEDGGVTWKRQVTPTDLHLKQVRFINALEGWVSGSEYRGNRVESVILTTNDGGNTWVTLDTDAAKDLSPVFFVNPRHACGIDDDNSIVCTTDGENWRVRHRDSGARKLKRSIFFANEKKGWVVGDGIWHTSDGGLTWEQQLRPSNTETLANVVFANDKLGWANTLQAVWRTKDGGQTWLKISDSWVGRLKQPVTTAGNGIEFSTMRNRRLDEVRINLASTGKPDEKTRNVDQIKSQSVKDGGDLVYVESWKTGFSQIKDQKISAWLDARRPEYETLISSDTGKTSYKLSIWPGYVRGPGSEITEWTVELTSVGDRSAVNLLKPSNDAGQDYFGALDRIAWLYPLEDPKSKGVESDVVPFLAARVIKVEGFYCIIRVKNYKLNEPSKRTLSLIAIEIDLTNNYSGVTASAQLKK